MEDFFEKYELLGVEKECESTKIYKARNKVDGNFICMYLLVEDCCSEFINDVYDNLDMYKNIDNENIMKIYNTGKCLIDGVNYYFIEKEYIEGKSLDDILKDLGRLDVDKALIIARHILDGLDYFYKNKSCDGNLRPRNIFVGTDSEVKLDLLVYPKHDECDLGYTSPEQAIVDYITIYDDIYSLGAILFRMITGRLPFGEFESREDVFKIVSGGLYFKEEDGLDDKLRYLFVKSLQARPLDRYFDLQEWMVDIDEYLKSMEEERKIVVIDGSDVNTYYLDDETVSEDIDNCDDTLDTDDDTECGVIIDEDINVINSDGGIKDIEDVVKDVEHDLSYLDGDLEDENIDEEDHGEQVEEVINMNVANTHNDEASEASNMNSSKIDTDKYSYTDNELHIDNKNDYTTEIMEEENDEDEEVDGDDEDYGSEKGTKRLKVMVGVLSVAVCVVGVVSFTFIKDMMGGSESHNDGSSQGEPVINMDDSEDEEEQDQDVPTVDNNEEDANTNEEETNPEESKTQEETNPGENNENHNKPADNTNNNQSNNNPNTKPEDGNQNGGNNNGGNNDSNNGNNSNGNNNNGNNDNNNNGSDNNGSDNNGGSEGGNPENPESPENPVNPDDGSGGNDSNNQNPPADNPSDNNNGEGQQPQIDQPPIQ